jgi:hypothetical protein
MKYAILLSLLLIMISGCSPKKKIIGLWQIEKVQMGTQEMTPIAKWTKFNKDRSQESGNGWIQHTVGQWSYSAKEKTIIMDNTYGPRDELGGFKVEEIGRNNMVWSRREEGQTVTVKFKRIDKLPTAPANKLIGVWDLKGEYQTGLFFRWDQIVVKYIGENKKYGCYKTHGHK